MLFKRQSALDYDLYDTDFEKESSLWYKFLNHGKGIIASEQLYFSRIHPNQMTIQQSKDDVDWFNLRKRYDSEEYKKFAKFDNDISRKTNSINNYIIIFTRKTKFLLLKKKYAKIFIFLIIFLHKTKFNPHFFRTYLYNILGYETLKFWKWKKSLRKIDYAFFCSEKDFICL